MGNDRNSKSFANEGEHRPFARLRCRPNKPEICTAIKRNRVPIFHANVIRSNKGSSGGCKEKRNSCHERGTPSKPRKHSARATGYRMAASARLYGADPADGMVCSGRVELCRRRPGRLSARHMSGFIFVTMALILILSRVGRT